MIMRESQNLAISKVRPNPKNARTHSNKQVQQIANSIVRFGFITPVVVDKNGRLVAGHGRYLAAQLLGLREIPVISITDLSEAELRAYALADNKLADNSGWDRALLAQELGSLSVELSELDIDIGETGFEPHEIDAILGDHIDQESDPPDDIPPPSSHHVSRLGDLFSLGSHRLICGDARERKVFEMLMGGETATMAFTDPPYNVRIKSVQGRGRIKHREFPTASGEMSAGEFKRFLATNLSLLTAYVKDGAILYVCMDWRHMRELQAAADKVHLSLKNLVVWVKTNAGQGAFYRSAHELIFVFKKGEAAHLNNFEMGQFGRSRSNVWRYAGSNSFHADRMTELEVHPTVKPVLLVADAMRDCSKRGDVILDSFMGSGTTIMAAEKVGRRAFGVEVDPGYVDVSIRRWQAFTKRDAIHVKTGKTFDELAEERAAKVQE